MNKKKSVLFIIGFTCPFPGAGWWRIFYFAKYFTKKGYRCYILSSFSPSTIRFPKIVRKENVRIYNMMPFIHFNNPFILCLNNMLTLITSFIFFLLYKPDTVIISLPPVDQLLPVLFISQIMRCKLVIDYRDEFEDYLITRTKKCSLFYRLFKKILTYLYKNALLVTTVTPAVAENLKARGVFNVMVVYDGVDTNIFRPFNKNEIRTRFKLPQDSFIIVYMGNVYDPYRVDVVVRALKKLVENGLQEYLLVLVGDGNIKSILRLAYELEIGNSVKYLGVVNDPTELAKILSLADCGVIPYDDDPLWQRTYSTKLFEYCAVGLPVIATVHKNSILATLIIKNKIGLIVLPVDPDALALAFKKLNNDKGLLNEMALFALKFARNYDKEKQARKLLEAIEGK
ncbi:MAG: glycosyltransferase family 4 protein [Candidatus Bathyarchaeia archaeon]